LRYRPGWERAVANGRYYTSAIEQSLDRYGQGLINRKSLGDAAAFCPNYSSAAFRNDPALRREFWLHLFSSFSVPESRYHMVYQPFSEHLRDNVSRSTRMDGEAFNSYSMGLFALTYKYSHYYPEYCRFNARADYGKSVIDPSLTIYNLKNQSDCAVGIMNRYVTQHGEIGFHGTAYNGPAWSTLMSYNPATRRDTLRELRREFPICFQGGIR
jgi:hypothetical protein